MKFLQFILAISFLSLITSCKEGPSKGISVEPKEVTEAGLSWYKIDDLDQMDLGDKKVMIDMYTSWCGWCKVMDKKTFTDPAVVDYLNDNFVMVKFNAERREPVSFQGETYEWINAGRRGANKLALKLMSGRMAYPTMVYLDSELNTIKASAGYKKPDQLLQELQVL
jgi:thioredoxin-related protein